MVSEPSGYFLDTVSSCREKRQTHVLLPHMVIPHFKIGRQLVVWIVDCCHILSNKVFVGMVIFRLCGLQTDVQTRTFTYTDTRWQLCACRMKWRKFTGSSNSKYYFRNLSYNSGYLKWRMNRRLRFNVVCFTLFL